MALLESWMCSPLLAENGEDTVLCFSNADCSCIQIPQEKPGCVKSTASQIRQQHSPLLEFETGHFPLQKRVLIWDVSLLRISVLDSIQILFGHNSIQSQFYIQNNSQLKTVS